MNVALIIASVFLAAAWLPLAWRFNLGWRARKNPVSLAICASALLFSYTNILFILALTGETTWRFFALTTHVFDVVVVVNFYVAFYWSDQKFVEARRRVYSIPPPNVTDTVGAAPAKTDM